MPEDRPPLGLLAPVPEKYLEDAAWIASHYGKVAFGSRKFELFRELDLHRKEQQDEIPVYIYASHPERQVGNLITWTGRYVDSVESQAGDYPGRRKFRPAETDPEDREGYWAVFWHVTDLVRLDEDRQFDVGRLRRWPSGRKHQSFTPEGPIKVMKHLV